MASPALFAAILRSAEAKLTQLLDEKQYLMAIEVGPLNQPLHPPPLVLPDTAAGLLRKPTLRRSSALAELQIHSLHVQRL
jgi:hypothetical protein